VPIAFVLQAIVVLLPSEGYPPPTILVLTVVHPNTPHGIEEEGFQRFG
jgi:hypothetical protein